jgi:hypothetical protein
MRKLAMLKNQSHSIPDRPSRIVARRDDRGDPMAAIEEKVPALGQQRSVAEENARYFGFLHRIASRLPSHIGPTIAPIPYSSTS